MKRTIFILMMMIFGVSVPSLAQKTVQKRINTSTAKNQKGKDTRSAEDKCKDGSQSANSSEKPSKSKVQSSLPDVPKQTAETQQTTPSQQSPYSDPNIIPNRIDDFKFTVNSKDHTATITKCNNLYGTVVIPSSFIYAGEKYTVTKIDNQAFSYKGNITSIIIPNTVTSIGREAFRMCTKLTSIIIPDGITVISYQAFEGCSSLTSIIIPNTVEIIGVRAFEGCWSLCSIDIPNSVTEICEYAFFRCSSLTSIKLSENLTIIGAAAFARCNLKSVYIPNSVKEIGGGAFSENKQLQLASVSNSIAFSDKNGKWLVRKAVFADTPLEKVTRRKENSNQTISDTSWQWFYVNNPNPRPSSPDPRTLASNGIDPNSMSWPAPKYKPKWFNEGRSVIVGWDINGKYKTIVINTLDGASGYYVNKLSEGYKTYEDAEAAAYYYLKSGKIRTRNKIRNLYD